MIPTPCSCDQTQSFAKCANDWGTHVILGTRQGRWISPDPAGLAVADPGNPQSWNRYGYVVNNPLAFVDFAGLECYVVHPDGSYDIVDVNAEQCSEAGGVWGDAFVSGDGPSPGGIPAEFGGTLSTNNGGIDFSGVPLATGGGAGGGGGAGAGRSRTTIHCLGQAAAAKGLSVAIDALGSVPAVGNLVSGVAATAQTLNTVYSASVALLGTANALLNPSTGAKGTVTSAAASVGFLVVSTAARDSTVIPGIGNAVSFTYFVFDSIDAYKAFQGCKAGH